MFTGIIESIGTVCRLEEDQTNLIITVQSSISSTLKIDQSIAHDGVCLTVTNLEEDTHTITAVQETLELTNLRALEIGSKINLERAMILGSRLDGHLVQGHVDTTAQVIDIIDNDGSHTFVFRYDAEHSSLLIHKGSVTINGVSLTVINPNESTFSVAIIPYTFAHTNFGDLKVGSPVNVEFDVIGKYVLRAGQLSS